MPDIIEQAAIWKRLAVFYLDFCMVYYGGGYLIDLAAGEPSKHGYLHGIIALAHLAVAALYFIVGWLYAGGTLWDRIFRIARPQPGDVEIPINTPDQIAVRAGFWRRLFALSIDSITISVLFQLMVAALFIATSGRIQMYGDLTYTTCSKIESVPDGLTPPPSAGSDLAQECKVYFLGAQTARILLVGPATKEGTNAKSESRSYILDRDGRPTSGLSVDWIALLALFSYLIVMETRSGATLGSRAL